jgi:hypothetical protein
VLQEFGRDDSRNGDYFLVSENLGLHEHRIETDKRELVQPVVVKSLHRTLIGYPNWETVIVRAGHGIVIIRDDEIIDGLRRENLPKEFQTIDMREVGRASHDSAMSYTVRQSPSSQLPG